MSYFPIKEVAYGLKSYYPNADETEQIIIDCAMVAAGADIVGSIIPGLAVPATIITCFGAVWAMYGKLSNKLGISFKKNVLKLIARAVLANIVANLGATIAAVLAGMFIPGASILASAVVVFLTIYLAGLVFLRLVYKLVKQSNDPYCFSDISDKEMKQKAKDIEIGLEDLEAGTQAYKNNNEKGLTTNITNSAV